MVPDWRKHADLPPPASGILPLFLFEDIIVKYWVFLGIAIIAEVAGTSSLKASEGFTKFWPSLIVVVGYAIAFYCLSLTLKAIPVGIAYAIWAGLGIVLISLAGWLAFGQRLDFASIVGMALIVSGVIVINVFSKVSVH